MIFYKQPIISERNLLKISLLNFFILALIGAYLRLVPVAPVSILDYKNVLHAHSHFAFTGWVFIGFLYVFESIFKIIRSCITPKQWNIILIGAILSAYGMLFSFPFQGYGLISIIFSTASILVSTYFAFLIWKLRKKFFERIEYKFLLAGLFFMVLSSFGPFATGPIIVLGYSGTAIYHNAVYFFLHFQYNGFFIFFILAVFYKIISESNIKHSGAKVLTLLFITCIFSFSLSVLWSRPSLFIYIISICAALIQLYAGYYLINDLIKIKWKQTILRLLMLMIITGIGLKMVLQLTGSFPVMANLAYERKDLVIAFLHLVLLGIVTSFIFLIMLKSMQLQRLNRMKIFIVGFILSFILSELLLVSRGLHLMASTSHLTMTLAIISCVFPLVALGLLYNTIRRIE